MAKVEENKHKRQETVDKKASQSKKPKTSNTNSNHNTTITRLLEDDSFMELEVGEQERVFPTPSEEEDNSEEGKIIDENEKLETVSPSNAEATEPKNKSTESAVRSWSASPRRSSAT